MLVEGMYVFMWNKKMNEKETNYIHQQISTAIWIYLRRS